MPSGLSRKLVLKGLLDRGLISSIEPQRRKMFSEEARSAIFKKVKPDSVSLFFSIPFLVPLQLKSSGRATSLAPLRDASFINLVALNIETWTFADFMNFPLGLDSIKDIDNNCRFRYLDSYWFRIIHLKEVQHGLSGIKPPLSF